MLGKHHVNHYEEFKGKEIPGLNYRKTLKGISIEIFEKKIIIEKFWKDFLV